MTDVWKYLPVCKIKLLVSNSNSIWPTDRNQSGDTTQGHSEPGSNVNEGVLSILQIYRAWASPSDCFMLHPGHCKDPVSVFYNPRQLGPFFEK